METQEMFINKSISLHLFYMRIAFEHLTIIQAALAPKYDDLINESRDLRQEAQKFLSVIVAIAKGHVIESVAKSQEIITPFTYEAERITEFLTGVKIDSNITQDEQVLLTSRSQMYRPLLSDQMKKLNTDATNIIQKITDYQNRLLESVLRCKIYLPIYPDRMEHIMHENNNYLSNLKNIQNMNLTPTLNSLLDEMIFWNDNLADHNEFIMGLLDPHEKESIAKAREFEEKYEELHDEAVAARDNPEKIVEVLNRSLEVTTQFQVNNVKEVERILACNLKSITLPLAIDHDLREVNHYLRILQEGKNITANNI